MALPRRCSPAVEGDTAIRGHDQPLRCLRPMGQGYRLSTRRPVPNRCGRRVEQANPGAVGWAQQELGRLGEAPCSPGREIFQQAVKVALSRYHAGAAPPQMQPSQK